MEWLELRECNATIDLRWKQGCTYGLCDLITPYIYDGVLLHIEVIWDNFMFTSAPKQVAKSIGDMITMICIPAEHACAMGSSGSCQQNAGLC